jgi:hypothetical protein
MVYKLKNEKAPKTFKKVFKGNHSIDDINNCLEIKTFGNMEIGEIIECAEMEGELFKCKDQVVVLKNIFEEFKNMSDTDIIYNYMYFNIKYKNKIFEEIRKNIEKHIEKIYKKFEQYFEDYETKPSKEIFFLTLLMWFEPQNCEWGIFNDDVLEILTTNGDKFSFTDTHPREHILGILDKNMT